MYLAAELCLQINLFEKSALIVIPAITASGSSTNSDPFHAPLPSVICAHSYFRYSFGPVSCNRNKPWELLMQYKLAAHLWD